jgi:hypothetical protein
MISEVIRFQDNDMVLVFDEQGEQMPRFQGRYEVVKAKILARAPKEAKFFHSVSNPLGGQIFIKGEVPRKGW